jgi:amino acid transporter
MNQSPSSPETRLRGTLSTPKIVFLVVAAAAPMASMVGTVPLAFAIGNGAGFPAMFVFAGLTLLCFSVGYAAMSRRIVDTGGFYTYIGAGLGKRAAVGGGLVAVIAYNAATVGLAGAFAYFAQLAGQAFGLDLPWPVWAGVGLLAMGLLGYRAIDLSVRVLAVLMLAEVGILVLLDGAVIARHGFASFPGVSFSPGAVFGTAVGVSLMFAFISYIGFESAALYGEEARNPKKSVPRATYISVVLVSVFYALSSWVGVGAVGPDRLQAAAGEQQGMLFFNLSDDYLGTAITGIMQLLLVTSLFAGMLAMHGAANRYLFVLGRERVLPRFLGAARAKSGSPHKASLTQTAFCVLVVAIFAVAGADPYLGLSTTMIGLGTLGIIVIQAAAAVSVIGFFTRRSGRHWWRTFLAPGLGFAGLAVSAVLLVGNFSLLTGSTNPIVAQLPWVLLAAAVFGVGYATWLKARRPERYTTLAAGAERDPDGAGAPADGSVRLVRPEQDDLAA